MRLVSQLLPLVLSLIGCSGERTSGLVVLCSVRADSNVLSARSGKRVSRRKFSKVSFATHRDFARV